MDSIPRSTHKTRGKNSPRVKKPTALTTATPSIPSLAMNGLAKDGLHVEILPHKPAIHHLLVNLALLVPPQDVEVDHADLVPGLGPGREVADEGLGGVVRYSEPHDVLHDGELAWRGAAVEGDGLDVEITDVGGDFSLVSIVLRDACVGAIRGREEDLDQAYRHRRLHSSEAGAR